MTVSELKSILKSEILNDFHEFLDNVKEQNELFRSDIKDSVSKIEIVFESSNTMIMKELNQHSARIDKLEKESRDNYGVLAEIKSTMQAIAKYNPGKMTSDIEQAHRKIRTNSSKLVALEETPGKDASKSLAKIKFLVIGCLISGLIGTIYYIIREALK